MHGNLTIRVTIILTNFNARGIYANTVFLPTLAILEQVYSLWNNTISSVQNVAYLSYTMAFQRIPTTIPGNENSLGLSASAGNLVLCLLSFAWGNAADDTLMYNVTKTLIDLIEQATKQAGLYNQFLYLNYAANFQDPLSSYGVVSKMHLKAVSRKYDPTGVFQTGVPGGFKLFSNK